MADQTKTEGKELGVGLPPRVVQTAQSERQSPIELFNRWTKIKQKELPTTQKRDLHEELAQQAGSHQVHRKQPTRGQVGQTSILGFGVGRACENPWGVA